MSEVEPVTPERLPGDQGAGYERMEPIDDGEDLEGPLEPSDDDDVDDVQTGVVTEGDEPQNDLDTDDNGEPDEDEPAPADDDDEPDDDEASDG